MSGFQGFFRCYEEFMRGVRYSIGFNDMAPVSGGSRPPIGFIIIISNIIIITNIDL